MTIRPLFGKLTYGAAFGLTGLLAMAITVLDGGLVHANGATYYVSPTGNDSANGLSQSTPWKTIGKLNSTAFLPGDRILFKGGGTFTGSLYFQPGESGTSTEPIVISSYGSGRPTISSTNGSGIYGYNAGGYWIGNVNVYGNSTTYAANPGIFFYNDLTGDTKLPYLHIDDVEVKSFRDGVSIGGGNGASGYSNVSITNSSLHDNRDSGLQTWGASFNEASPNYALSGVYVGHVKAYNNLGNGSNTTSNSGSGIILGSVNGGTIERSVAYANGANCIAPECGVGIWAYNANGVTIQSNESYNNRTGSSTDGDGFDLDINVSNSTLQYNYSHGNDGAGYLLYTYAGNDLHSGNTVRYNISANDGRKNRYGGITMSGNISWTNIYNNVVYMAAPASSYSPAVQLGDVGTANTFRNNIFYTGANTPAIVASSNALDHADFQGNNYYNTSGNLAIYWGSGSYTSLNAWRSATYQEVLNGANTGYSVNPKFVAPTTVSTLGNADNLESFTSYKLQAGSPMIGSGLNLSTLFGMNPGSRDFYGAGLYQGAPNVGIHEN